VKSWGCLKLARVAQLLNISKKTQQKIYKIKKTIMKSLQQNWRMWFSIIVCNLVAVMLMAQDNTGGGSTSETKSIDISVNKTESWYASPWVWVIGAAVFILILVALLSGGSRSKTVGSDRVTVTKTVERDTDV
jgi:hypothetical protein